MSADRVANLQRAMQLIADAVEDLPAECRDLAGNALLNVTAEAVAQDVGCLEAGRIFARLADLLARGLQPPSTKRSRSRRSTHSHIRTAGVPPAHDLMRRAGRPRSEV